MERMLDRYRVSQIVGASVLLLLLLVQGKVESQRAHNQERNCFTYRAIYIERPFVAFTTFVQHVFKWETLTLEVSR